MNVFIRLLLLLISIILYFFGFYQYILAKWQKKYLSRDHHLIGTIALIFAFILYAYAYWEILKTQSIFILPHIVIYLTLPISAWAFAYMQFRKNEMSKNKRIIVILMLICYFLTVVLVIIAFDRKIGLEPEPEPEPEQIFEEVTQATTAYNRRKPLSTSTFQNTSFIDTQKRTAKQKRIRAKKRKFYEKDDKIQALEEENKILKRQLLYDVGKDLTRYSISE